MYESDAFVSKFSYLLPDVTFVDLSVTTVPVIDPIQDENESL